MMGSGARHQRQSSAALQQGCRPCKGFKKITVKLYSQSQKHIWQMAPKTCISFISELVCPQKPWPWPWPVGWSWLSGDVTSQRIPDSLSHQALPAVGAVRSSCCSFLLHPGSHRGERERERGKKHI